MINPRILSITQDAYAAEDATDTPALRAAEAAQQDATVTLAVAARRALGRT